jgi:hypothetical protein
MLSFTGRLLFVFLFVSSGLQKLQTFDVVTVRVAGCLWRLGPCGGIQLGPTGGTQPRPPRTGRADHGLHGPQT